MAAFSRLIFTLLAAAHARCASATDCVGDACLNEQEDDGASLLQARNVMPQAPQECCSWYPNQCGPDAWCNEEEFNCEKCGGIWITVVEAATASQTVPATAAPTQKPPTAVVPTEKPTKAPKKDLKEEEKELKHALKAQKEEEDQQKEQKEEKEQKKKEKAEKEQKKEEKEHKKEEHEAEQAEHDAKPVQAPTEPCCSWDFGITCEDEARRSSGSECDSGKEACEQCHGAWLIPKKR